MKKFHALLTAAFLISTAAIGQSGGALNLKKGQKLQVENKIETSGSTDIQGQKMEMKADVNSTYSIEIKDASAAGYNLTNTLSHITMSMEMMGQQIDFNSDSSSDMGGPMGTVLKEYINKPKDIETDRSGNITKAPQDTAAGAMAAQMNFAQTGYGTQLAFLALPKNAKAGAAWSDSSNDGAISRKTNYSIKSVAGNVATVSFEGTMATKSTIEQQGMEVSTNTTGKFSGEETVDIKSGIIQSSNTTSDASGTVTAMGQEFPTSAKVTSATTVKVL